MNKIEIEEDSLLNKCWICKRTAAETGRDVKILVRTNVEIPSIDDDEEVSLNLKENYPQIHVFNKEEENEECRYHSVEDRTIVVPLCVVCAGLFSLSRELTQSYIFDVMEDEYVKSGSVCTIMNKGGE